MTFYEAALQILLREGKPLHARDITELAIKENLLSHVGKQPEITMASRLAAMARRSEDRRLVAVDPDTFGLTDWSIEPSPEALEKSGVVAHPEEGEPPLRGRERHPKIDKENARVAGRGDRRRKYEELERKKKKKKKRLPPIPELVYEILDRVGRAVPVFDLAASIREHDLVGEDIGREALENALRAENERREGEGRSAVFSFPEGGQVFLAGRTEQEEVPAVDRAELLAGVVAKLAEERKPAAEAAAPAVAMPIAAGSIDQLVAQERERAVTLLRQRLAEIETSALEAITQSMLDTLGYRDVRVAKRHKDGALFTTRRRMGLTEVRFAVRVVRGGREVRREDVAELRRDMQSHSAQMGVIVSPSDPTREARSEAAQATGSLVTLLCADALAEQLAERGMGVRRRTVTVTEFDPAALRALAGHGGAAGAPEPGGESRRETAAERRERRERERREWREKRAREREERRKARHAAAEAAAAGATGAEAPLAERAVSIDAAGAGGLVAGAEAEHVSTRESGVSAEALGETPAAAEPVVAGTEPAPAAAAGTSSAEAAPVVERSAEAERVATAIEQAAPAEPVAPATVQAPTMAEAELVASGTEQGPEVAPAPVEAAAPAEPPAPEAAEDEETEAPDRPRRRRRRARAPEGADEATPEPEAAAPAPRQGGSEPDEQG